MGVGKGTAKFKIFNMAKIILVHYIRPNSMLHTKFAQFWISINILGHSKGPITVLSSMYGEAEIKDFFVAKIISVRSDGLN